MLNETFFCYFQTLCDVCVIYLGFGMFFPSNPRFAGFFTRHVYGIWNLRHVSHGSIFTLGYFVLFLCCHSIYRMCCHAYYARKSTLAGFQRPPNWGHRGCTLAEKRNHSGQYYRRKQKYGKYWRKVIQCTVVFAKNVSSKWKYGFFSKTVKTHWLKITLKSHLNFLILALSTNFCGFKIEMSGSTVKPQASNWPIF